MFTPVSALLLAGRKIFGPGSARVNLSSGMFIDPRKLIPFSHSVILRIKLKRKITSKRQENDEEDEDHHRNFNAACSAIWQFSSKLLSIFFEAWQGIRESFILWWAFFYMTVKSRIWWAFLTGTATKYRKLALTSRAQSSYSPILVWSNDIAFAHTKLVQVHDTLWLFPSKRPTISGSLQSCK